MLTAAGTIAGGPTTPQPSTFRRPVELHMDDLAQLLEGQRETAAVMKQIPSRPRGALSLRAALQRGWDKAG